MRKNIKVTVLFVSILMLSGKASAFPPGYLPHGTSLHLNIAQMGMGGLTTLVCSNAHTLFYNPALLSRQDFTVEASLVSIGVSRDIIPLTFFIQDHIDDFAHYENMTEDEIREFTDDSEHFDSEWLSVQALPYAGIARQNFGFGFYSVTQADMKLDQGIFLPRISLRSYSDFVIGFGYGSTISILQSKWDIGATIKYAERHAISPMWVNARDVSNVLEVWQTAQDSLRYLGSGFGLDIGVAKSYTMGEIGHGRTFDLGVVVRDLFLDLNNNTNPEVNVGVMYHMPHARRGLMDRWDVGGEIVDVFNREHIPLFQRVHFGSEISFLHFLRFRGGIHQGYATFGAGLTFRVFSIDYASFAGNLVMAPGRSRNESIEFNYLLDGINNITEYTLTGLHPRRDLLTCPGQFPS